MLKHNNHSNRIRIIAIVATVIFIIIGIITGYVLNAFALLSIWLYAAIQAIAFYIVYAHIQNQEIQIENLNEIRDALNSSKKKSEVIKGNASSNMSNKTDNPRTTGPTWVCPLCKTENPLGAKRCSNCNSENFNA